MKILGFYFAVCLKVESMFLVVEKGTHYFQDPGSLVLWKNYIKKVTTRVHNFSVQPFWHGPFLHQFGAFWLTLTLTLTLNNWTVKEHWIGDETICAEKEQQRNRWRRNGCTEKTWSLINKTYLSVPLTVFDHIWVEQIKNWYQ